MAVAVALERGLGRSRGNNGCCEGKGGGAGVADLGRSRVRSRVSYGRG
jgi:hypothetical protein